MTLPPSIDPRLLMHATLDGELDGASAEALKRELAASPILAAEYEKLVALRDVMRRNALRKTAPPSLVRRIEALAQPTPIHGVAPGTRAPARRAPPSWLAYAASLVVTASLASSATFVSLSSRGPQVDTSIVAAHMRGLLAPSPVDVISTDRHTVKPWFDQRLALSPPVIDLAAQGYDLLGGRADVVATAPVPTLVYRRREHLISLTAIPNARGIDPHAAASIGGYRMVSWHDADFTYWATSDIEQADLDAFVGAYREAAKAL